MLTALLTMGLVACSTPTPIPTPTVAATLPPPPPLQPPPPAAVVKFADPVLEAMVRGAMGQPQGEIQVMEAEAVTRLDLNNEWQRHFSAETAIKDIRGLEYFTNLAYLDLSYHAVSNLSPLEGLTKLNFLSLGGNPVTDLSPLTGLTNLKGLILTNCTAQDYSPLAELVHLEILKLDHSTIMDVSPLASLTSLQQLNLANCPVKDYSPLKTIYPNLGEKDFTLAFTLKELGFSMNDENNQAFYNDEQASIMIHHSKWGAPPEEWDADIIRMSMYLEGDYKVALGFYGDLDSYVFRMNKNGETLLNYVYDTTNGNFTFRSGDLESSEQAVRTAFGIVGGDDVLLAPVRIFTDTIQNTFSTTAEALYALPFEPPTLKNLGFFPDKANAVYRFEQREGRDVNIEVHRPEWGEKDYDVRFFTPLSDEYRIVVTYYIGERKFVVGADDNEMGGANFELFIETHEHIDGWCSNKDLTVEEYFINAYNDPLIEDIYLHSVELMEQYFSEKFGMTIEELYALPAGE